MLTKIAFGLFVFLVLLYLVFTACFSHGAKVTIQSYSVNANGQVQLTVNSDKNKYYILRVRHHPDSAFRLSASMTLGQDGKIVITEALGAYPIDHYEVREYSIDDPNDTDGDGVDDMTEYKAMPFQNPLNASKPLEQEHALISLNTPEAFKMVSAYKNGTSLTGNLKDIEYAKFLILDFYSDQPKVYFINGHRYDLHLGFTDYLGVKLLEPDVIKGQLIKHPSVISANGTLGTYAFSFANNETQRFEVVQRTQELLAANIPWLTNNLSYLVTKNNEQDYQRKQVAYRHSRIPVLFESDAYAGINYWGLNQAEGYGFFRLMSSGEVPGARDIVLCETLPNSLPRVGGMITSAIQSPLSHLNLRAIYDHVPNAFIRNPLEVDSLVRLLNHYVYFKAGRNHYEIREATSAEVNSWYERHRPSSVQTPPLNLTYQTILPLSGITFSMYDGFGAKVANVATMRTFGFAEGTIPDGFGIPFYFYMEFMKHNRFFGQIELMLKDSRFISDRSFRDARLKQLRSDIRNGSMPAWMLEQLLKMQKSFPGQTSIRCRSSTNNEDLPGYSGAGLYDSKTHHPREGTISKTIQQVYASLWNLRAFEEREFYRVDHLRAAMGVLCHPNYDREKVNGVGISADPVYKTANTFYLNSQWGEELITNSNTTFPEELLIKRYRGGKEAYSVIQYSSLAQEDSMLMTAPQLELLRRYLSVIHDRFAVLYKSGNNPAFAMDIEYKIDRNNRLIIKQARPWVSYFPGVVKNR